MEGLTRREREVAYFVSIGFSNQAVADRLGISLQTVKNHTQAIYKKLMVKNRVQLSLSLRSFRKKGPKWWRKDRKSREAVSILERSNG